jgi:ABC-2 type transport system ATP-binding protein
VLEAIDLTKRYGSQVALDRLNLTIEPGEVFCLLGANGAGKTTTINLFLNFIEPSGGTARINGLDVTKASLETKKHLAYIPEQVMLYRNLTGLENLEYFTALASHEYPRSAFIDLFRQVGLPAGAEDKPTLRVFQSPDDLETFVKLEGFVRGYDRNVFHQGLRDDLSIERIRMVRR